MLKQFHTTCRVPYFFLSQNHSTLLLTHAGGPALSSGGPARGQEEELRLVAALQLLCGRDGLQQDSRKHHQQGPDDVSC